MNKIKVIFLDVDSVLNSKYTQELTKKGAVFIETRLVEKLQAIIEETDAEVVLSSDWRYDRNDPRYNSDFLELQELLRQYGIEFYDYTPETHPFWRGGEIQEWLDKHPEVESFVILDDRNDIEPNMDRLVQTLNGEGITDENVAEAIGLLNQVNES